MCRVIENISFKGVISRGYTLKEQRTRVDLGISVIVQTGEQKFTLQISRVIENNKVVQEDTRRKSKELTLTRAYESWHIKADQKFILKIIEINCTY